MKETSKWLTDNAAQFKAGIILVVTGYDIGPTLLWFLRNLLLSFHSEGNIKMDH